MILKTGCCRAAVVAGEPGFGQAVVPVIAIKLGVVVAVGELGKVAAGVVGIGGEGLS